MVEDQKLIYAKSQVFRKTFIINCIPNSIKYTECSTKI